MTTDGHLDFFRNLCGGGGFTLWWLLLCCCGFTWMSNDQKYASLSSFDCSWGFRLKFKDLQLNVTKNVAAASNFPVINLSASFVIKYFNSECFFACDANSLCNHHYPGKSAFSIHSIEYDRTTIRFITLNIIPN